MFLINNSHCFLYSLGSMLLVNPPENIIVIAIIEKNNFNTSSPNIKICLFINKHEADSVTSNNSINLKLECLRCNLSYLSMIIEAILKNENVRTLLDFLFPPLCLGCGEYTEDTSQICKICHNGFQTIRMPFCLNCDNYLTKAGKCPICVKDYFPLFVFGHYAYPLDEVIKQFKFKGIISPAETFTALLNQNHSEHFEKIDVDYIIPIPLYSTRENIRGYNQAELLARHLSKYISAELRTDILYRTKKRKPQARLEIQQRIKNIAGVFELDQTTEDVKSVILVDDVVTSGATLQQAKKTLIKGNFKVVGAIAIAHAD